MTAMTAMALPPRRVVIFDVGGVVAESPIVAIRLFCQQRQLADLNRFLFSSSAWHRLERAQMAFRDFPEAALKECQERGVQDGVNLGLEGWRELLQIIRGVANLRPVMLQAIQRPALGPSLGNNVANDPSAAAALARFRSLFDHFIESSASKMRKPETGFYQLALDTIGCKAHEAIFLDDIGKNLKPAAAMGIHTILVENNHPEQYLEALEKLQGLVNLQLTDLAAKL